MKRITMSVFFCLLFLLSNAQVVSLNHAELGKLRKLIKTDAEVQKHWKSILQTANEALSAKPNPADTLLTEGILQGDPRKARTWKSIEDMQKVYALTLAFKVEGGNQYLDKASDFFLAWASRNTPMGNPINDTNLDLIIFAFDLVKNNLKAEVRTPMMNWLSAVANQELNSFNKAAEKRSQTYFNNWNSHRIKEVAEVAWAIDNQTLKNWVLENYKIQVAKNLLADGSSFDFHERDALHYHVYDVDPLMVAATIIFRSGELSENPYLYRTIEGSSLKKSIDWLVPFYTGAQTRAEWVNSKSAFDKKRAANGEKGYIAGTLFKPEEARSSIALAHFFDPSLLGIFQAESKTQAKYPTWQFVLNSVKR